MTFADSLVSSPPVQRVKLTPREEETLDWIIDGRSIDEAASLMGIPPRTAKYYSDRLRVKFGVARRRELIRLGREWFDDAEGQGAA